MIHLLPLMLERVGIIIIIAFLFARLKVFRTIINNDHGTRVKLLLVIVFGGFGIISNYTGIEIQDNSVLESAWLMNVEPDNAIANTRIMGIGIGALLGGPVVGFGIGLIAGVHRLFLGGFTAEACALSAVLAGLAAGYIGNRRQKTAEITPWFAVGVGVLMEMTQMGIILLVTEPFEMAWNLVQLIGIPMIVINGFGTLLFMFIIQSILREEERFRALQTNKAFHIADQTLPFFRQGLNTDSCKEVAQILLRLTDADAVAITNDHGVLAHVGDASDHHVPGEGLATGLTKKVLGEGKIITARRKEEIYCFKEDCPLQAAIVLPLKVHNNTVGTLKLYFKHPSQLKEAEQELAEGLAKLFSTQLELAEAELQSKLLKDAEIKALQAQVHPHFLFNSINTISVLCRTNPEKARKLLLELSVFFRSNLQGARQTMIPLEKELEHVQAYLSLEQARFPNKYEVLFNIEQGLEKIALPPFTLQPLVENAIRHAFPRSKKLGRVTITASSDNGLMHLTVEDNGRGVSGSELDLLGKQAVASKHGTGTALVNIRERLDGIYNMKAGFHIESEENKGTKISISIPLSRIGAEEHYAESIYSRR
ncbi:sensor histidine kinase [Peribacillus saganii]|uniref:histidine kinase n=1 Tax=Peribacillus saganii TaxID=2303992 RepID=A0A372LKX4_9BACI|nr:sensor histidine kinase [Peribacillus saganii]RFU67352.1 sensor histidine kinase [Peribacillus saganii]